MPDRQGSPISVLFVDDDEVNLYAGARLLRLAGYKVIEATTGANAIDALTQKPDIAVCDVQLPDVDGFTLCQQIKSRPESRNLPVLLMSATFTSTADRVQGLEGGADGYLVQPFELPVLRATISAILRVREAEENALKLSQQWQTTFDAITDGIWILDDSGHVVRSNEAMAKLWNSDAHEMEGKTALEIVQRTSSWLETSKALKENRLHDSSHHDIQAVVHSDLQSVTEREVAVQNRWFRVVSHPVGSTSEGSGTVQVWSDITQRKLAEQERILLLESEKSARLVAEEASRHKDEFLATLSHELRTPLMAIIGWTGLLTDKSLPEGQLDSGLQIIDRNARAQAQIINDLLDVSRVIAGKMQLHIELVDLSDILDTSLASVQPGVTAKNIEIISTTKGEPKILGDAARLQQILWNLLTNAVKFTPQNGTIEVHCGVFESTVKLQIRDSGQGIAPEFLPYVFDRFRQADSSTTRRHGGLGLGLAIVRHLTEMHGGQVEVNSSGLNTGTTFTLSFPLASASSFQTPIIVPQVEQRPVKPLEGLRILVVDDQEEVHLFLNTLLQHQGAHVLGKSSAQEAFLALSHWLPDVLVSDLGMPEEDGYSLIQRIRSLPARRGGQTPALALSAYADAAHRHRALEVGFNAFASKPIEPKDLIHILTQLTNNES